MTKEELIAAKKAFVKRSLEAFDKEQIESFPVITRESFFGRPIKDQQAQNEGKNDGNIG